MLTALLLCLLLPLLLLQFTTVSGGISNVNARLMPKAEFGLEPVMFKVFGDKTEQIIDREAEKVVVVALGNQGFGPKVCLLKGGGTCLFVCVCVSQQLTAKELQHFNHQHYEAAYDLAAAAYHNSRQKHTAATP